MQDKIIKLRSGSSGRLKEGHPWIRKSRFLKAAPSIKAGDVVSVVDPENRFMGKGYYNPGSEISIRLLTFKDEPVNKDFFHNRIRGAAEKRESLLTATNAYRAVFSEADGLPGLIVDVYSDTAVFQILTLGMEKFRGCILESVKEILRPRYIYEKSESPFRKLEGLKDVKMWHGDRGDAAVEIFEGRARFIVDIENGHKTGFYLDQRKSRAALANISKGRKVLDLFCYTGSFSICAALFGAEKAQGVDIKGDWLALAQKNAALNGVSEKTKFLKGDAFNILRSVFNSGEKFDIIIIDPPSFVKSRWSVESGLKGYKELNMTAMKALNEGGILATFSCSHYVANEAFAALLKRAARDSGKRCALLRRCRQAGDHPVAASIPETEYLKGYFLKVHSS